METISCVRAVVGAAGQYDNNPSDTQLVQLHRQLDVRIFLFSVYLWHYETRLIRFGAVGSL